MNYPLRLARLILGFFLCAFSLAFGIYSTLGLAPWNVFAEGVSLLSGITMGRASQYIGFFILFLDFYLKEPIGVGSILNMVLIGFFLDLIMFNGLIPIPLSSQMALRALYLFLSMLLYAIGVYFYMGAGMGSGPRDGLMVALVKRAKGLNVGIIKGGNDVIVTFVGWLLGGLVGLGTLITAVCTGYVLELTFKVLHFDIKSIKHESVKDTYQNIFKKKEASVE